MPDAKITALASIGTGTDPANDPLVIVDVSDVSPGGMSATGTTKKVTLNNLLASGPAATLSSATITGAATVGTTLGVTGAATFTGAVVCNGAVTLGDAVGDAVTATGSFTSYNGQNPSAIRAAASDYAAVTFDGATASTRITSTLTGQNIGTGDFSMWSRFRVPTSIPSGQFPGILSLTDSSTTTSRANAFRLVMTDSGSLQVSRFGVTTGDVRTASIVGFRAAYSGQVVDIVVTRTGATLKVYINGTDTAYTDTASGTTPPAWSDTVVSDFVMIGATSATATTIFSGRIYRSVVFNRALSATDVTELITTGVNPADQWGTQTAVLNATFAGTTDSFIAAGAGVSVASVANQLEVTCTTATGGGALRTSTILNAKNYRVTFKARLQSGDCAGSIRGGAGQFSPIGATTTVNFTPTSVLTQYLFEFTNTADTSFYFRTNNTINPSVVEFDDLLIERIGAIVDLDFTVGAGYQATDRSTNALHGTLFNGVEFTQPKRVAVLYATTAASGNTQLLGSLAIPTNAVIEDVIVNSTGSSTVSVGNVSAGTQVVNAASVVSGRQKLTIATPFSTTGNLWVNSSAAVTLQFTILYTIAA